MRERIVIELARHHIAIEDEPDTLLTLFGRYRAAEEREPELTISVANGCVNGIPISAPENSRFFLVHKIISDFMIERDTLTVHASAVRFEGRAYLFCAPSGTGKSTHTRFWRRRLGKRVAMISDDQPFVRIEEGGAFACGSPYNGKEKLGANIEAPIAAICLCSRKDENELVRLKPIEAMTELSTNIYIPREAELAARALQLIKKLAGAVPIYRHSFTKEPAAADFAIAHLTGTGLNPE